MLYLYSMVGGQEETNVTAAETGDYLFAVDTAGQFYHGNELFFNEWRNAGRPGWILWMNAHAEDIAAGVTIPPTTAPGAGSSKWMVPAAIVGLGLVLGLVNRK